MARKEFLSIENILPAVEGYLHAIKNEGNFGIKHRGLYGDNEVFEFLERQFGEFDISTLARLFKTFGIDRKELFVFFSEGKEGLFAMQKPWNEPFNSYEKASGTFSWTRDKKTRKKIFTISGITEKHLLAARFEAGPKDTHYQLKGLDVGMTDIESQKNDFPYTDSNIQMVNGLITPQMIKMTKNPYKIHLVGEQATSHEKLPFMIYIPPRLPIGKF